MYDQVNTMKSIFPKVRPGLLGPIVSKKLLNRAKKESVCVLTENKKYIESVFSKVAGGKCVFNLKKSIKLIQGAVLSPCGTCFGFCDGEQIWINNGKMHYRNVLGTLIHEALHGTVYRGALELTEDEEHDAMEILGDWYAKGGGMGDKKFF